MESKIEPVPVVTSHADRTKFAKDSVTAIVPAFLSVMSHSRGTKSPRPTIRGQGGAAAKLAPSTRSGASSSLRDAIATARRNQAKVKQQARAGEPEEQVIGSKSLEA